MMTVSYDVGYFKTVKFYLLFYWQCYKTFNNTGSDGSNLSNMNSGN